MKNWILFTKERFPLVSHLAMIALFVGSHYQASRLSGHPEDSAKMILIFCAILVFFYKMRLYDEIKDYELDVKINPTRPLPRGLVTLSGVKKGIAICIALEILTFSGLGVPALSMFLVSIGYSLLMYKEFFIPQQIRPHLTTYAVMHTVVTIPMGLSIFCGFTGLWPWELEPALVLFAICNWPLFNIFEFGRKTFSSGEERNQVESYSKIFGPKGAVTLVFTMALASVYLVQASLGSSSWIQIAIASSLLIVGFLYAVKDSPFVANLYRNYSSLYIVLFYICYLTEAYWKNSI